MNNEYYYECLRTAHFEMKSITFSDSYDNQSRIFRMYIWLIHEFMYRAEKLVCHF